MDSDTHTSTLTASDRDPRLVLIRREQPDDSGAIDRVHREAFAAQAVDGREPVEVGLVHDLRGDVGWMPSLSLVAEDRSGSVVGHVVCTRGSLSNGSALGLGPIGVLPSCQGGGIGSALMHAALGAADALDFDVVVLLGHRDYYPRFGFVPASQLGIAAPQPDWGEYFQARPLSRWNPAVGGEFQYAAPFAKLRPAPDARVVCS